MRRKYFYCVFCVAKVRPSGWGCGSASTAPMHRCAALHVRLRAALCDPSLGPSNCAVRQRGRAYCRCEYPVSTVQYASADELRTYCPGPNEDDHDEEL